MEKLFLIFVILILGVYYSSNISSGSFELKRKKYVYSIIIILILFSGLRNWAVGSDTYQYYYWFERVSLRSWNDIFNKFINWQSKDPFFDIFLKIFQIFSKNFQIFLMLVAIIFMSALGNFILRNTDHIRHAILAFIIYIGYFYGFFSITGIRQTVATAFLLFSFEYIKSNRFYIFLIFVIIASLFHISALVFLPLYFIANIKYTKLFLALSLLGFPLIMYFKNQIAFFFVLTTGTEERYGYLAEQFERGGSFILTTFSIILAVFSLIIYKHAIKKNPLISRYYNTYALALFFLPLQWVHPSAGRISQYFAVIIMVWIPFLLDVFSGTIYKQRQIIYIVVTVLFIGLTMFTIKSLSEYKFFWQFMPVPY